MAAPPSPSPSRRRRTWLRVLVGVVALLVLLPVVGIAVFALTFDAEAYKPRIQEAVRNATGRELTLAGPIGLAPSLVPTITVSDVSLSNMPGGSRPQMVTMRRAEAQIALLPLLSRQVEIRRLVLVEPDVLLETDAQGQANWQFRPEAAADSPPPAAEAPPPPETPDTATARRLGIAVDALRLEGGRITYRDGGTGQAQTLEARVLEGSAPGDGPVRLDGTLVWQGVPVEVRAETGSLAAIERGTEEVPLRLVVTAEGARLSVQGTAVPAAQSWRAQAEATAEDLSRLARLLPDVPLPPIRNLNASATAAGTRAQVSELASLALRIGESDLNALQPGLTLRRFEASAPALDQPLRIEGEGALNDAPVGVSGTVGPPSALLPALGGRAASVAQAAGGAQPAGPWPVDVAVSLPGQARLGVQGAVANPALVSGVDLRVALQAPDLNALSPLAGTPLPALRDVQVETRLSERTRLFLGGAHLREFSASSHAFDAAGDLELIVGERPGVAGRLASRRVDLDAVLAAIPAQGGAGAPGAAPAPPPRPAAPSGDGRVIPDVQLPLAVLRLLDGNLNWTIAELTALGATYREASAQLALDAGRLRLDPVRATTPGGPLTLRAAADVTQDPPVVQVAATSPGLDLAALSAAHGGPAPPVRGRLEIQSDLRGRGSDLRAVAASLHGPLGLALVDGRLDRSLLAGLPQEVLRLVLPGGVPADGLPLRCFALRAESEDGVARTSTLLLDTALGRVGGGGAVNLRDESLALRMLPDLRVGNVTVRAPINVGGTLANPRVGVDPAAAAAAGIGAFLSQQQTPDRTLQALAGALGGLGGGGGAAGGAPQLPDCATALAAARGGASGAQPSTPPAAAAAPQPEAPAADQQQQQRPTVPGVPQELQGPAQQLLRGLFGR